MRKDTKIKREWSPAGWLLLAVLCAAAFWLGQALFNFQAAQEVAATIPNDLFAAPLAVETGVDFNEEAQEAMVLKMVCLTFDDGPSKYTEEILSILQQYDVPATFFVTAQDANQPYMEQVKAIVDGGHQLALHSASHSYKKIYANSTAFWLDIKELRQTLANYVDVESIRWLRFPGGSTNTVSHKYGGRGIMKMLIREAEEKGYEWIDWNVSAEDATKSHPNAAQVLKNIQNDAKGRDVCVVLMHDTKATGETVKALPQIIEWFQEQGYQFLTVEQMHAQRNA